VRIGLVFIASLIQAGCALQPVAPPQAELAQIQQFSMTGRMAVRQADTRHHVSIDWRHTPERDEILLATPFGQGIAELVRDASGARLTLADRRSVSAADWDTLAQEVFGVALPLNGAHRWLLGDPAGAAGWRVTIHERDPAGLPTLIELERDEIEVRLKVDAWQQVQ
jgi:outer membrane lipoprotein LolB